MLMSHENRQGTHFVWSDEDIASNVQEGTGATFEHALSNFRQNMDDHIKKLTHYNWKTVKGRKL